jgi:hypothetical protein
MVEGQLRMKDQTKEYVDRGDALEHWSYLDYFLGTYDGKTLANAPSRQGRSRSLRVAYREGSNRPGHCRIIRSADHETMPYFPGQWFPKRDSVNENGLFEASMLALLKPWRSVLELKRPGETFKQAFESFVCDASDDTHVTIRNIEFFHESCGSARNQDDETLNTGGPVNENEPPDVADDGDDNDDRQGEVFDNVITDEQISRVIDNPFSAREQLFADTAMGIGFDSGALTDALFHVASQRPAAQPSDAQLGQFQRWEKLISGVTETEETSLTFDETIHPTFDVNTILNDVAVEPSVQCLALESPAAIVSSVVLNKRQTMVHDIVANHLRAHLRGQNPKQHLMVVHGQGGTGKSALLNALSTTFDNEGASSLLAKTAMSGVAASIVGGQTLHSWGALPINTPHSIKWVTHPSKETDQRRKKNMGCALWLTIDEMSMLTTPLLVLLSQATGVVRTGLDPVDASVPFGGLNVILLGDFHQFPPVASSTRELYNSTFNAHVLATVRKQTLRRSENSSLIGPSVTYPILLCHHGTKQSSSLLATVFVARGMK